VTAWLLALASLTFVGVWVAGGVDLLRRADLRPGARLAWLAAIVVLPALGALLYALSRPVPVDRTIVGAPEPASAGHRAIDRRSARTVQHGVRLAARGLFRSVEVVRPGRVAATGPQLWCASHFGAFSDPIVLLHALERQPRFLAGDFLFRVPVFRSLLRLVAALPVRRSQDGGGAGNRGMFAASHEALAAGDALAIFPEGVATEGAALAPLRTGAARIALGARAEGVAGIQLVPVGIHYQDRAALRRRVFVDVGPPLELDDWLRDRDVDPASASDEDHALVRALTDDLDRRLREVSPQFRDLEEAVALHAAAAIALRDPGAATPTWGRRSELATELARRPDEERTTLADAVTAYRAELDAAGISDAEVAGPGAASRRRLLLTALAGLVLLPFALAGALVHLPLVLLVRGARRLRVAPPTLATVLPALALVGALVTWGVLAWLLSDPALGTPLVEGRAGRASAIVLWLLVLPLWGWAALVLAERGSLAWTAARRRRRAGRSGRGDLVELLRMDRAHLIALVGGVTAGGAADAGDPCASGDGRDTAGSPERPPPVA
jgi:glycerol-3-phosphate O-acyltransferase / dihydroxyacetone phosphate acyltransferase